jgi:DNA-binding response OmpR family regulator
MANILVVEDEIAIADLLLLNLKLAGYKGSHIDDGDGVMDAIALNKPDLIVLDVMLPGKSGFELMKEIEPLGIPVIFLTAKAGIDERVMGLKLGAEDYMVKPFAAIELITRIETVLKRCKVKETVYRIDDVEVFMDEHLVLLFVVRIELTTKEYSLLVTLIENKNIALSRERLLELIWGYDYVGETRTVDVHIQKLRKKLRLENRINTVYKLGYRLEVPR